MGLITPRTSVWEGLLACLYVCVLCVAALVWVLWTPAPDRSQLSRPTVPPISGEAAAVKTWNERVWAETARSFDPTISPCAEVDAWHRAAGVR